MRHSNRDQSLQHGAEALCGPLSVQRTQWSRKKCKEMRLTADQRVKISIIKVMFQSLNGEKVQTDLLLKT